MKNTDAVTPDRPTATFPYAGLPKYQIWKRAVSDAYGEIDPQIPGRFRFSKTSKVGSAGSCFALRIAENLRTAGYTYLVTEPSHDTAGDITYSARYGDIYTTLQLAQLARRCIGAFAPLEPAWLSNGRCYDPFRPRVEPNGFVSVADLEADRVVHLAATRRVFEQSDIFIFTLGLTETWLSRTDGAAFPLCPGAGVGSFDAGRYEYRNLNVDETITAFESFLEVAWKLNPKLRILLSVSPVPLAATMEPHHVVASTLYSKSVLRVAAETLRARHPQIDYFAAYEIVSGAAGGDPAFAADGRAVLDHAVARVMRSFFGAFGEPQPPAAPLPVMELSMNAVNAAAAEPRSPNDPCDEDYLAGFIART